MVSNQSDFQIPRTVSGFGVDVAVLRADDLDKTMIAYVKDHVGVKVLDIGSGAGGQSLRLAQAGANVTALDINDYAEEFVRLRNQYELSEEQLAFIQSNLQSVALRLQGETFDLVCCQRTLHYVPYKAAEEFLQSLHTLSVARLYISVTGLATEIASHYPASKVDLTERFAALTQKGIELFSISEPLCLYTANEFAELLTATGWQIESIRTSAFGNHRVVAYT